MRGFLSPSRVAGQRRLLASPRPDAPSLVRGEEKNQRGTHSRIASVGFPPPRPPGHESRAASAVPGGVPGAAPQAACAAAPRLFQ